MRSAFLILVLSFIFFSCSSDGDLDVITEKVTISNTETYEYDLGGFGDEDGAVISIQAKNFQISELIRKETIVYTYKSAEGFLGSDRVRIEIITGSDGASSGKVSSIVEIIFNVTE